VDGWAECTPIKTGDDWQYQFNQNGLASVIVPDIDYEVSFVAYVDKDTVANVVIEDPNNDYAKFSSTDARSRVAGETNWDIPLTTEPTKIILDASFPSDKVLGNSDIRFQFNLGWYDIVTYIDSVIFIAVDDKALLTPHTPVETITVSGADGFATVDTGQTLQMSAEVMPAEATYQNVKWSVVQGTGYATIDNNGLLSADSVGKVTVYAMATDDSGIMGSLEVTLKGSSVGIEEQVMHSLKVYPNPAVDMLNVEYANDNSIVSIYNSIGVKMEEAFVYGGRHVFDVSRYPSGIYFVKSENSVVRFIK
jgi:hypothetical protein